MGRDERGKNFGRKLPLSGIVRTFNRKIFDI
jgi:hypothetical protein